MKIYIIFVGRLSEEKGLAFAGMIQEFICPRIYAALGLASSTCDINEDKLSRNLLNVTDIAGRSVSPNTKNSVLFNIYDDGSVEKTFIIK